MNKLFRFVSLLVVLVLVLGFFTAPMSAGNQVSAQKEVPTFVVAPTEIPTDVPVVEPTAPSEEQPTEVAPVEPGTEITPEPSPLPGADEPPEVVPLIEAAADVAVPGRYIIVLKDGADKGAARQAALEKIANGGGRVAFEYASALDGITAEISPDVLRKLRQDGRIEFIEQDQMVSVHDQEVPFGVQSLDTSPDSWGLDRIDQVSPILDGMFYYPYSGGIGVNIYIIDSGIRSSHENFNGRVSLDFDAIGGSVYPPAFDCHGHGTHVAGTAAGGNTGVARSANIHSVRVLDCMGSGYASQIIAGINWVAKNHIKPAVANMSLGGWQSPAEDAAVSKAIAKGVTFVVAAGNDHDNACNYSPARVAGAITVGATDNTDTRASFSNYGKCVDIFAPGVDIYSSTKDSNSSYDGTWDGTSMAAPHVAGVAALFLAANPTANPAQVAAYITSSALSGIVIDPAGSPNRLLHIPTNIPKGPVQISPSNNLTSKDQTPLFSWKRVTNGDIYHVIISKVSNCSTVFDGLYLSDPSYEYYTNLPDDIYYWKVAAINTLATQETWSPCWKFTVDTTGPAAPALTFPATVATVNGYPTFKWLASAGAKTYRLAYDTNELELVNFDFTSQETTKLLYKPNALPINIPIYWRVQAKDSLGNWGAWSAPRKLWVNPLPPAAPKLSYLINNASTRDQTPELRWKKVQYAAFHRVEIATEPKFLAPVEWAEASYIDGIYPVSITLAEGKYYWRVKARNDNNVDSAWSTTGTFVIDLTPPAAPTLNAPGNGTEVIGTPNFTWSVPVSAKTFEFQYDIDPLFSDPYKSGSLTKANHKPFPVMPPGTYNWRVRALDSVGNPSAWSTAKIVTILPAPPAKVTLTSPKLGFYADTSIELGWTPVNYAHHYELQMDNNSAFNSVDLTNNSISGSSTTENISSLSTIGKWYWRVRAVNSNSVAGPWSVARYFVKSAYTKHFFDDVSELGSFTQHPGATWHIASGSLYNNGIPNSYNTSSISYNTSLSNFTVSSEMMMDNSSSASNVDFYGLVIRGAPTLDSWNDWTKGYYFMIIQDQSDEYNFGCFRVYRLKSGPATLLTGFCDPIIAENTTNDLSVNANGKFLRFNINGVLAWQGTDPTYTTGRVGLFNYSYFCDDGGCSYTSTHDTFYADDFRISAPINIASAEVLQPNPAYGVGADPYEIKFSE